MRNTMLTSSTPQAPPKPGILMMQPSRHQGKYWNQTKSIELLSADQSIGEWPHDTNHVEVELYDTHTKNDLIAKA